MKPIDSVESAAAAFGEKGRQLSVGELVAFGIPISTRYGDADELIEMISFCKCVAAAAATHFVESLFYDSQACVCVIKTKNGAERVTEVGEALEVAAASSIAQYELFGFIGHRRGSEEGV